MANDFYITVKELKKFLKDNKISDYAKIYYQRVEDIYFKNHGWKVKFKPNVDDLIYDDEYIGACRVIKYKNDKNLYFTAFY